MGRVFSCMRCQSVSRRVIEIDNGINIDSPSELSLLASSLSDSSFGDLTPSCASDIELLFSASLPCQIQSLAVHSFIVIYPIFASRN